MGNYLSGQRLSDHHHWNGGINHHKRGIQILCRDHHRADKNGYVFEHILIAEKVFGRELSIKNPVHHYNGNPFDNKNGNLIICEDQGYHLILHQRTRAFQTCGHAHWRKCPYCKQYDDPIHLNNDHRHPSCVREFHRKYREAIA